MFNSSRPIFICIWHKMLFTCHLLHTFKEPLWSVCSSMCHCLLLCFKLCFINIKINVALSENASRTRYTIKIKLKLRKWVLKKKSFQLCSTKLFCFYSFCCRFLQDPARKGRVWNWGRWSRWWTKTSSLNRCQAAASVIFLLFAHVV